MIHDFPDHRCRHVMIQRVVIVTHSAGTKHHIDPPICRKKMIQKCKFQKRNDTKLVDDFFFGTCIFVSYFFHTHWWIISFLELAFLGHIFSTQIVGSFLFWNLHFQIIFVSLSSTTTRGARQRKFSNGHDLLECDRIVQTRRDKHITSTTPPVDCLHIGFTTVSDCPRTRLSVSFPCRTKAQRSCYG